MRTIPCLAAAVFAFSTHAALAADTPALALKTTKDLYQVCAAAQSDAQVREKLDLCEGFLLGVVSYHDAISDRRHLKRLICYPSTATRDQGIQSFVIWASSHQQDQKFMNEPPVFGVVRALAAKWPCP